MFLEPYLIYLTIGLYFPKIDKILVVGVEFCY